jgi:Tfp pilus assembly protein PilF
MLGDLRNAERDLSNAIDASNELAFTYGAYQARAKLYQQEGRADLAKKDLIKHGEYMAIFK